MDPALCRIWEGHNRDYAALTGQNCADLIESFKAQGRQEVPAIVRRVAANRVRFRGNMRGPAALDRCWMRAHNYTEFRFLVEPRDLRDEEAFRIADLENRSREDLSDSSAPTTTPAPSPLWRQPEGMAERLKVWKTGSAAIWNSRSCRRKSWLHRAPPRDWH